MRKPATIATTILILVAAFLGALVVGSSPASAEARGAGDFVGLINGLRASRGLAPLTVDPTLAATAQTWSDHMAATATLVHDPAIASEITGWTKLAENVGNGPSVDSIWRAFQASPTHLANLLDPDVTHVGVGVSTDGRGGLWTTHRFMRQAAAPVVTAPPPAPAPAPAATPAPGPVVTAPAPAPVVTAPAAAPVVTTPAPAPVEQPPAPAPAVKQLAQADRVAPVLTALMALD